MVSNGTNKEGRYLTMLITEFVITEACNLACKYCYMKNRKQYMTEEDVELFIKNIDVVLKEYGMPNYHISYFGGEPLLNWEVLKYAYNRFSQDPRLYSQVIISNLLEIDEEKVDFIKSHRLGVSWSFDGLWQNENRPYYNSNKPSLEKYLEKKDLILNGLGARVCKTMVAPENISTMTENLEYFINEWNVSPDFSLVRDPIWSPDDIKLFDKECTRLADKYIELTKQGNGVLGNGFFMLAILDSMLGDKIGKRPFGCFAGHRGIGYLPGGLVYPCARFGSNRKLLLWNFKENKSYPENIRVLKNPELTDPRTYKKCQSCGLYQYCNAGCTYSELYEENGQYYTEPVSSVCALYHIIYREAIRIVDELKDNKNFLQILNNAKRNIG